jgi:hypothetical protein
MCIRDFRRRSHTIRESRIAPHGVHFPNATRKNVAMIRTTATNVPPESWLGELISEVS